MLILPFLRQKSQTYPCRSDFFSALEIKRFQGFFLFSNRKVLDQASGILCTKFSRFEGQSLVQSRWVVYGMNDPLPFFAQRPSLCFRMLPSPVVRFFALRSYPSPPPAQIRIKSPHLVRCPARPLKRPHNGKQQECSRCCLFVLRGGF